MRTLTIAFGLFVSLTAQAEISGCADLSGTYEVTDYNCVLLDQSGSTTADSAPGFSSPIEWPCQMKDESGSARASRFQPGTNLIVSQVGCEEVKIEITNKIETTDTGYTFGGEQRVCTIGKYNSNWVGEFNFDGKGLQHIDNRTFRSAGARRNSNSKSKFKMKRDAEGNLVSEHAQSQVIRERFLSAGRTSSLVGCKFKVK